MGTKFRNSLLRFFEIKLFFSIDKNLILIVKCVPKKMRVLVLQNLLKHSHYFTGKIYLVVEKFSKFTWNCDNGKFMGDLSEIYQRPRQFFENFPRPSASENFRKIASP